MDDLPAFLQMFVRLFAFVALALTLRTVLPAPAQPDGRDQNRAKQKCEKAPPTNPAPAPARPGGNKCQMAHSEE